MSKSYLGNKTAPRGIRNNNPGNLRLTSIPWQGKIPRERNTDGAFEQFDTVYYGIRAMATDVINDIAKGRDTIQKLITEYAPASDGNHTHNYIMNVAAGSGLNPTQKIPRNIETIQKIIASMIQVENGSTSGIYLDQEDINHGISMINPATRARLLAAQTAEVMRNNPFKTVAIAIGLIWLGWSLMK